MLQFNEGDIIAGKYRVERAIGRGGMGIVLAARHTQLEERVAIKLMLPEAAAQPEAVTRFVREARAAAKLESIHVARVSDVGTLDSGEAFMVMEYLDGCDLSQLLKTQGPVSVSDAVDYVLQAAAAIAEAHSIGIVHRDLKPSNLFLTRRRDRTPLVKVLDFGISKVSENSPLGDGAMTQSSSLMGSPLYMSPEQMMSMRDVDGRSDIWAMGVILYELLSGTTPFVAESLPKVCAAVMSGEPRPLHDAAPTIPPELVAAVMRCLAKHPSDRFQTVAEFAKALVPFSGAFGRTAFDGILRLTATNDVALTEHYVHPVALTQLPRVGSVSATHAAWAEPVSRPVTKFGARGSLLAAFALLLIMVGGGLTGWILSRKGTAPASSVAATAFANVASATVPHRAEPKASDQIVVRLQPVETDKKVATDTLAAAPPTPVPPNTSTVRIKDLNTKSVKSSNASAPNLASVDSSAKQPTSVSPPKPVTNVSPQKSSKSKSSGLGGRL